MGKQSDSDHQCQPLKTGQGLLHLNFLQPFHPGGGVSRSITLKVIHQSSSHIVGVFEERDDRPTAIISCADFDWMESYSSELIRRRPPQYNVWLIDGETYGGMTFEEYLTQLFGSTERELLTGTDRDSFSISKYSKPKKVAHLSLGVECPPLDSWLISRGFTPKQMEDKWFIYMEDGRLFFRRSWTGILIYDVEAYWRGNRLYLGEVRVNRNAKQYSETDDAYDKALLQYVIDVVLRGVPAEFPLKEDCAPEPLQAWSVAGKASLS